MSTQACTLLRLFSARTNMPARFHIHYCAVCVCFCAWEFVCMSCRSWVWVEWTRVDGTVYVCCPVRSQGPLFMHGKACWSVCLFVRAESPHLLAWHTLLSLRQRYWETLALSRDGTSSLYQTLPPSPGNTREVGCVCVYVSEAGLSYVCVCVCACRRQIASPPDPNTEWHAVKLGVQSCIWKVCFSLCHVIRTHASPSPS